MPSMSSLAGVVLRVTGGLGVDTALPMAKMKAKKPQIISANPPNSSNPMNISIVVPSTGDCRGSHGHSAEHA